MILVFLQIAYINELKFKEEKTDNYPPNLLIHYKLVLMQQQSGSDLPPIKEFVQMLTLFLH